MLKISWGIILFIFSTVLSQANVVENKISSTIADKGFERYKKQLDLEDVYIAFVQPSLTSPMSYYGHTFLVFKKQGSWEFSKTFSFTAVIPNKISSKNLILDGVTGKLSGRYVIGNFHEFKREYLSKEQRGIQLYKLNLSGPEKELLLAKSFQIYNDEFPYHFFQKNCSTEIINYLSVVRPTLSKNLKNITMKAPSSTLNLLINENLILKKDITHFSQITHSFDRYLRLDKSTREQIDTYLISQELDENFDTLKDNEKEVLTNISSLMFNFLHTPPPMYHEIQNQIHPKSIIKKSSDIESLAYTSLARLSLGLRQVDNKTIGLLSFMPSHLERFEERFSIVNESTLKTFYTAISYDQNKIKLEKLDILEIAAYNKSFSKVIIPTWRVYAGYNDLYSPDNHSLISEIGYGLSFGSKNVLFSFMPQIKVDINNKTITSQFNTLFSYWHGKNNFSYNFISNHSHRNGVDNVHKMTLHIPLQHDLSLTTDVNLSSTEFGLWVNKRFSF